MYTASQNLEIARHTDAHLRISCVDRQVRAESRSCLLRRAAPGSTTHDTTLAARIDPGAGIGRGAQIAVVPAVLDPVGNVAVDVAQTERIGRKLADRRRSPVAIAVAWKSVAPAPARRGFVAVTGQVRQLRRRVAVAPPVTRRRAGT